MGFGHRVGALHAMPLRKEINPLKILDSRCSFL